MRAFRSHLTVRRDMKKGLNNAKLPDEICGASHRQNLTRFVDIPEDVIGSDILTWKQTMTSKFKSTLSAVMATALAFSTTAAQACTSFILKAQNGDVVYARTMEFALP